MSCFAYHAKGFPRKSTVEPAVERASLWGEPPRLQHIGSLNRTINGFIYHDNNVMLYVSYQGVLTKISTLRASPSRQQHRPWGARPTHALPTCETLTQELRDRGCDAGGVYVRSGLRLAVDSRRSARWLARVTEPTCS